MIIVDLFKFCYLVIFTLNCISFILVYLIFFYLTIMNMRADLCEHDELACNMDK